MAENKFLLYDSTDKFCNDVIQDMKNNNLLSMFVLIDKNNYNPLKVHAIIRQCLIKCELPTLLLPNISTPIEKLNVKGWIQSRSYFNIKTNNIKTNKEQKPIAPSIQDKLGIPKQEIKKISDSYTFIDDTNTIKSFENTTNETLILKDAQFTIKEDKLEEINPINQIEQKAKLLRMLRAKKK